MLRRCRNDSRERDCRSLIRTCIVRFRAVGLYGEGRGENFANGMLPEPRVVCEPDTLPIIGEREQVVAMDERD